MGGGLGVHRGGEACCRRNQVHALVLRKDYARCLYINLSDFLLGS